jgi:hypothetical protein
VRIKTNVADLIARLQAYKRRQREAFEEAKARYPELEETYRAKVIAALEKEIDRLEHGRPLPPYSGWGYGREQRQGVFVNVGAAPPAKPTRPVLSAVDRRIAELRLSSAQEITIDTDAREWRSVVSPTEL